MSGVEGERREVSVLEEGEGLVGVERERERRMNLNGRFLNDQMMVAGLLRMILEVVVLVEGSKVVISPQPQRRRNLKKKMRWQ